ncbi:MAG: pyridoxamine 5'-phosphate oxidase family protein [Gemmatimonadetes bacterium]|nr:pyridoxamine 5'-phosphate oxidase family protein [Gemmatimonadota bacterium]
MPGHLSRWSLVLLFAAGLARPAVAQERSAPPTREQLLVAAREIMNAARYCTMVTNGADTQPQARIIDAFSPDAQFMVWIATNRVTRKVAELKANPRVTLLYYHAPTFEYVTLQGTATFSDAPAEKAAHWKPEWAKLYKDEYRGPDYLLIKIVPSRLEIVSVARGIDNDAVTWRPTTVSLP